MDTNAAPAENGTQEKEEEKVRHVPDLLLHFKSGE
jgi:hypothetical protein